MEDAKRGLEETKKRLEEMDERYSDLCEELVGNKPSGGLGKAMESQVGVAMKLSVLSREIAEGIATSANSVSVVVSEVACDPKGGGPTVQTFSGTMMADPPIGRSLVAIVDIGRDHVAFPIRHAGFLVVPGVWCVEVYSFWPPLYKSEWIPRKLPFDKYDVGSGIDKSYTRAVVMAITDAVSNMTNRILADFGMSCHTVLSMDKTLQLFKMYKEASQAPEGSVVDPPVEGEQKR